MSRKRRMADSDLDDVGDSKRRVNWSQEDAERLAQLLMEHGREGILNKQTNGATNAKKKKEWGIVLAHFNSDPTVNTFFFLSICIVSLCAHRSFKYFFLVCRIRVCATRHLSSTNSKKLCKN